MAMRRIDLQEYGTSEPLRLSVGERDALRATVPSLTIESAPGVAGVYCLKPGSTIGALEIGDLSVAIRPKLDISRVLYLASYALGAFKLREERFDFEGADTPVEALALALASAARRAFARGLLHGYRTEEEALHTVRGRILVAEQIRRRFGVPVPIEVRYDEFTEDILANRLVKAAAGLLGRMRIRSPRARAGLRWIGAMLGNVAPIRFAPSGVPAVTFDRLNAHYREVVALARLILRHWAFEADRGGIRAGGFLMNMNTVFQDFVTQALREELRASEHSLRSDKNLPANGGFTSMRQGTCGWRLTSRGGMVQPAHSSATQSTRISPANVSPTPTCINCSPTPPPSTCRAGCWPTRKARRTRRRIRFATPVSGWRSSRLSWAARLTSCGHPSAASPRGYARCVPMLAG